MDTSIETIKSLIKAIDETVKDEEIKSESKEVLNKIGEELIEIVDDAKTKISNLVINQSAEEE